MKVIIILATLAGCATEKPFPDDDFSELRGLDQKSDKFSSRLGQLGGLGRGEERGYYLDAEPRYRGFFIGAQEGDLEVTVRSRNGDALAWLTDSDFKVLRRNDNAFDNNDDARITYHTKEYATLWLIFRDYYDRPAHFRVKVDGEPEYDDDRGCRIGDHHVEVGQSLYAPFDVICVCKTWGADCKDDEVP